MWSKLDDALIDHRKFIEAGSKIGKNGQAIAIGFYVVGLLWTNKQLTDGFLPTTVVKQFPHVDKPLTVAAALAEVQLWDEVANGYRIHDFHDFNFTPEELQQRREYDRARHRRNGQQGGRPRMAHK